MPELTSGQREAFDENGFLVVPSLILPDQAERLRKAFEHQSTIWAAEIDVPVEEYLSVVSQWTNVWETHPEFRAQVFHERAAAIASELIRCERVRLFHDHLIVKPPYGGATIPWHRDLPNWPIAEPRALSCWLALDDVTPESGAMRFMPGAQKEPITRSIDFLNESKNWGARERDAVTVPVSAGSAIFHHCLSWHMSPPNLTNAWRRAYITIFMDATCTFDPTRADWHPMTSRVSAAPGSEFNDDSFPILGPKAFVAAREGGA